MLHDAPWRSQLPTGVGDAPDVRRMTSAFHLGSGRLALEDDHALTLTRCA
jgi:hypothetical protein